MKSKNYNLEKLILLGENGRDSKARHIKFLLKMYNYILLNGEISNPIVVEFGVADGMSTTFFADAVERRNGRLSSFDIKDCSNVIKSNKWNFYKTDDRNIDVLFDNNDLIKGKVIDLIYIDSFCYNIDAYKHILELLNLWTPYLKTGGMVGIHGIDSMPYQRGGRKEDNNKKEMYDKVLKGLKEFYYTNENNYCLELHLGSVGMAFLTKL